MNKQPREKSIGFIKMCNEKQDFNEWFDEICLNLAQPQRTQNEIVLNLIELIQDAAFFDLIQLDI